MAAENIAELVESLSPPEQEAVRKFIEFLKGQCQTESPFIAAVDEFIAQHPELLRRLAQ
jgi:hypothetical protein